MIRYLFVLFVLCFSAATSDASIRSRIADRRAINHGGCVTQTSSTFSQRSVVTPTPAVVVVPKTSTANCPCANGSVQCPLTPKKK